MNTIPAQHFVDIIPNVVGAGGKAIQLNGLILSRLTTVPIGTVASFPDASSVAAYFGPASIEAQMATIYFQGYTGATATPGNLLFVQRPFGSVAAYLRGGSVASYTIAKLNSITGTLILTVDGRPITTASLDLSQANSFSDAAATIQTAIGAADTTATAFTGSIASSTTTGSGFITGSTLTLHGVPLRVFIGSVISGSGIAVGTTVTGFLTGTGGAGTYTVTPTQTTTQNNNIAITNGLLTVTGTPTGAPIQVGQVIQGGSVVAGTQIVGLGTGAGGSGTYYVTPSQTVGSTAVTVVGITCTYDSNFGAFVITSGTVGPNSTITFATGTASAALKLIVSNGAVISQGAAPFAPLSTLMDSVIAITQNWASFAETAAETIGNQLSLASWASASGYRYAYVDWSDNAAIVTPPDTTSAFYQIDQAGYADVIKLYATTSTNGWANAAFIMGYMASIDFTALNGRADLAYKSQPGQPVSVTSDVTATLLESTGINYYGITSEVGNDFSFIFPGAITGKFQWVDTWADQVWLNSQLRLALLELLTSIGSIPYNQAGYALIRAAMNDPIQAAVNFGAIRAGVPLSALQIAELTAAAGLDISSFLFATGYFLQILDASPQVRAARGSPPINLFYVDGQSVQKITVNSVLVD